MLFNHHHFSSDVTVNPFELMVITKKLAQFWSQDSI
jgi:hypothetical protein